MSEKYLGPQIKKLGKVLERAQKENSEEKKELIKKRNKYEKNSVEWNRLNNQIDSISTISDGTKKTYFDTVSAVLKESYEKFGITHFKNLKQEHTEKIIKDRIEKGQSASTIRKVVHALDFVNKNAEKMRVFKEKTIELTNHEEMLNLLRDEGVRRTYKDSHRYRASKEECLEVIKEMEKRDKFLADVARYQLLTGFRVSEAIRQQSQQIDLENDKHHALKAKGNLNNVVHTNHHSESEKEFIERLIKNKEEDTGRIFSRRKDEKGNYKSDDVIRRAVTRMTTRCAEKLGIGGDGKSFSSHTFRSAFGYERMLYYVSQKDRIDEIVEEKIKEQPRLASKYSDFEKRIKEKTKNPAGRKIQDWEKVQWLVSTDLNHSRQDVVRYYVDSETIKRELAKY